MCMASKAKLFRASSLIQIRCVAMLCRMHKCVCSIVSALKPFCFKSNSVSSHLMMTDSDPWYIQLLLRSETRYYSQGTIIADSREEAKGLIVITSGQVRDS
jgi:hypothetical protein